MGRNYETKLVENSLRIHVDIRFCFWNVDSIKTCDTKRFKIEREGRRYFDADHERLQYLF